MNILKELFPYKQFDGKYRFKYFITFTEEGIQNEKYFGYTGGRAEIFEQESQYDIDEYRYLTKRKSFWGFRDFFEFKNVNIIGLFFFRQLIKYYRKKIKWVD